MNIFTEQYRESFESDFLFEEDVNNNSISDKIDKKIQKILLKFRSDAQKAYEKTDEFADGRDGVSKLSDFLLGLDDKINQWMGKLKLKRTQLESLETKATMLGELYCDMNKVAYILEKTSLEDFKIISESIRSTMKLVSEDSDYKIKYSDLTKSAEKIRRIEDKADKEDKDIEIDLDESVSKLLESKNTFTIGELNKLIENNSLKQQLVNADTIIKYHVLESEIYNMNKIIGEGFFDGIKNAWNKVKGDGSEKGQKVKSFVKKQAAEVKDFVDTNIKQPIADIGEYMDDLKVAYDAGNIPKMKAEVSKLFSMANKLHAKIKKAEKYQAQVADKVSTAIGGNELSLA